jgi:hypothetical protein
MAIAGGVGRRILPDNNSLTGIILFSKLECGNFLVFSQCPSSHGSLLYPGGTSVIPEKAFATEPQR